MGAEPYTLRGDCIETYCGKCDRLIKNESRPDITVNKYCQCSEIEKLRSKIARHAQLLQEITEEIYSILRNQECSADCDPCANNKGLFDGLNDILKALKSANEA